MKGIKRFLPIALSLLLMGAFCGCETNTGAITDPYEEESDLKCYYEYSDEITDRQAVEGKLAVYFFRGDASMDKYDSKEVCGDATLVIAPNGETMLIDCNITSCAPYIVDTLLKLGITKLDYFVNSHPHGDHIGGWETLLRYIEIGQVYRTDSTLYSKTDQRYVRGFIEALDEKEIPHAALYKGDKITMGANDEVVFDVMWPSVDTNWAANESDLLQNECSIVMTMRYGDSSFFFGGDIGTTTESLLLDEYDDELDVDIAKMNHHGWKNTSESIAWIRGISPMISVGERYLPLGAEEIYADYACNGAIAMFTSLDKTIRITTTGDGKYGVQAEKNRDSLIQELIFPKGVKNGFFALEDHYFEMEAE